MSWKTQGQSIVFDAFNKVSGAYDAVVDKLKGVTGSAATQIGSALRGTSFVGINGNKIPEMRNAIRQYVSDINANLDKVVADASTVNAFHGEYATAVTEYVTAVKELCKSYTSSLLEFSDNLDLVAEIYHNRDTEFASSIRNSANETSSESQTMQYQEQRADRTYGSTSTGN